MAASKKSSSNFSILNSFIKNINNCDVVFYNKTRDSIDKININENGKFIDDNKKLVRYPSGFFDANTDEVWALL